MADGGFERRDPAFTKIDRWRFTFNGPVEITSEDDGTELHAQVADEQQECGAHRTPLGALIVDVNDGDCEIGARLVGRPAERAGNHHALDGPRGVPERTGDLDGRARVLALRSVLVEENGAMVLSDRVEVPRQGTVAAEARPLLHANHMPRAIEVRRPASLDRKLVRVQGSKRGSGVCQSDVGCAGQAEERGP